MSIPPDPAVPGNLSPAGVQPIVPQAGPHTEPDDREEVYFEGSPPIRSRAGEVFLFGLVALGLIALAVWLAHKHAGPWWVWLIIILIGLILPLIPAIKARAKRYRITNYRIDVERGLVTKNIDTLELWHIEDLHFHQSLLNRIFDVGSITVKSRDETMPTLDMQGIPNPRPIYDMLKQRVIAVKRQRGVIKMDPG